MANRAVSARYRAAEPASLLISASYKSGNCYLEANPENPPKRHRETQRECSRYVRPIGRTTMWVTVAIPCRKRERQVSPRRPARVK
jgi:hypothetical protein